MQGVYGVIKSVNKWDNSETMNVSLEWLAKKTHQSKIIVQKQLSDLIQYKFIEEIVIDQKKPDNVPNCIWGNRIETIYSYKVLAEFDWSVVDKLQETIVRDKWYTKQSIKRKS